MYNINRLSEFERIIRYSFTDKNLLITALTHPSFCVQNEGTSNNYQRLEFLGDAVLSFILTEELFKLYPEEREGALASYRAVLVQGIVLASLARKINLPNFVLLSDSEFKTGGNNKDSILEDVLEALIGAIYIDSDVASTRKFIQQLFPDIKQSLKETLPYLNPKGKLQELVQQASCNALLEYSLLESTGPDHNKSFTVNVLINGEILGFGSGSSKKIAEEQAATEALGHLKLNPLS